ncbi:MAG TPA: acyl-CoA dehydrogenase family protein [Acidimicrobiales bacterium]|nr:acyl-CoA dehydrogenase family protein [Acidimicrobiales bacterium]
MRAPSPTSARRADGEASEVLAELDAFVASTVAPLEAAHAELLADPRRRYAPSGVLSPAVVALRREVRVAAADAGLYQLAVPAELGGRGAPASLQFAVFEHLHASCGPDRLLPYDAVGHFTSGPGGALGALSDEVRETVWPEILSGRSLLCFALSEPEGAPETTALERDGDFVLNGTKCWVSRGGYADYALVYARTGDGPPDTRATSAFLVPLAARGVAVGPASRLFGRVGGEEVTLALRDVRVPRSHLVGALHGGATLAASGAPAATMHAAGRFVGLARFALERALRELADRPVARRDSEALLADAAIDWHGVRQMALDCAERLESGADATFEMAAVRLAAPAMCSRVHERVAEILGGDGLRNEERLFDGWHQSRTVLAAAGSDRSLRGALVASLLARRGEGASTDR